MTDAVVSATIVDDVSIKNDSEFGRLDMGSLYLDKDEIEEHMSLKEVAKNASFRITAESETTPSPMPEMHHLNNDDHNNGSDVAAAKDIPDTNSDDSEPSLRDEEVNNVSTDRFGFYITHKLGRDLSAAKQAKRDAKEAERTTKWVKMLKNWNTTRTKKSDKLKRRVRKGIPDAVRAKVWAELVQLQHCRDTFPSAIDDSRIATVPEQVLDEIQRDVDRTFPRHVMFVRRHGSGQKSLRRILQLYAAFDPEVNYCQGMGFIAGMLLTYYAEEDALYFLIAIMQRSSVIPLRSLYLPSMHEAQKMLLIFHKLHCFYQPQLAAHMAENCIHYSMYATEWFMTLYTRNFSFALVTWIWDIYLNEGFKIIYRVALALLKVTTSHEALLNLYNAVD